MEIMKVAGIGLIGCMISAIFTKDNKEYAMFVTIICSVILLSIAVNYIYPVIDVINTYSVKAGVNSLHIKAIFKIIATAYIASFTCDILKDNGNKSLGMRVELCAKVMIVYFSLPIILSLFEYIGDML